LKNRRWPAYSAIAGFGTVALACLIALSAGRPAAVPPFEQGPAATTPLEAAPVTADPVQPEVAVQPEPPARAASLPLPADPGYYSQLRSRLRWVQTRVGADTLLTPDLRSRMLLAKSAAQRAGLTEVGLSFRDVYGIINAETSWVPRDGASKDGTPNLGIAQFEPATAKALGLRNPDDPVEAVHAAAMHMRDAARWSAERLEGLKLGQGEREQKLREGVSIYYNLSTRGRNAWNGKNTDKLPRETLRHIQNARLGAQEAALLEAQLQARTFGRNQGAAVLTASSLATGG
jgi:hypothetical protein